MNLQRTQQIGVCFPDTKLREELVQWPRTLEHGEWLTARGRLADAQPMLAEARDTFERLEAQPWLERIDAVASGTAAEVTTVRAAGARAGLRPRPG